MKLRYDPESDILYLHFKDGRAQMVKEVADNVMVETDARGEVMGIEMWEIRKRGVLDQLAKVAAVPRQG